jgi:hypothetical protein
LELSPIPRRRTHLHLHKNNPDYLMQRDRERDQDSAQPESMCERESKLSMARMMCGRSQIEVDDVLVEILVCMMDLTDFVALRESSKRGPER